MLDVVPATCGFEYETGPYAYMPYLEPVAAAEEKDRDQSS